MQTEKSETHLATCHEGDSKSNIDLVLKTHFLFPLARVLPVHQLPKFFLEQGPSVQGPVNVDRTNGVLASLSSTETERFPPQERPRCLALTCTRKHRAPRSPRPQPGRPQQLGFLTQISTEPTRLLC